jgi:hypothetical protein
MWLKKWMFCLIFLLGHNILGTELMARQGSFFGLLLRVITQKSYKISLRWQNP